MIGLFTGLFSGLLSVTYTALAFVFRTVVIKFILFFALFYIVHEFVAVMSSWLPQDSDLRSLFDMLPASAWYFLDLFLIPTGLTQVLNALVLRFIIRRIPFIG